MGQREETIQASGAFHNGYDGLPLLASAGHLVNRIQGTTVSAAPTLSQAEPKTEEQIRKETEQSLLQILKYDIMYDRRNDIKAPVKDSFEWVFKEHPPDQKWSSLPAWLRDDSGPGL